MTIEEKLEHFQSLCFQDARERSEKMLSDYTDSLRKTLEEHKRDARRQAGMRVDAEAEIIRREINKELSLEQISIKREFSNKQEELKKMLMNELRNRLALFMESPEYERLLERQVKGALEFAAGAPVTIYLDPCDADKLHPIALHTGAEPRAELTLSQYSFLGGSRAVIPSKNILIDNSFLSKLEDAEANFKFRLGGR